MNLSNDKLLHTQYYIHSGTPASVVSIISKRSNTHTTFPLLLHTKPVPCQRARVTVCLHCSRRLGMMINTCHTFATAVSSASVLSSLFKLPPFGHRSIIKGIKSGFASPVMTLESRNKFKSLKWK